MLNMIWLLTSSCLLFYFSANAQVAGAQSAEPIDSFRGIKWGSIYSQFKSMLPPQPDEGEGSDTEDIIAGTSEIAMDTNYSYFIQRKHQSMFGSYGTTYYIVRNSILVGGRWYDEYVSPADLKTTINLLVKKYGSPKAFVENGMETVNPQISEVTRKLVAQFGAGVDIDRSYAVWSDIHGNQIHLILKSLGRSSANLVVDYLSRDWIAQKNSAEDY